MEKELKILAQKIVDAIARKVKKETKQNLYKMGRTVDIGADGTPTKYVDKIAEEVAIRLIKKSDISVNLLSEEAGFLDFNGKYTFILDPVDGTRNAYRGIPFYAVSLAIGISKISNVEYGIVKNIPTGDVFVAEKGHGAFLNSQQIQVCEAPPKEMLSSLCLGRNYDKTTLSLAKKNVVRSLGSSSLEMCMVAIGGLDCFVLGKEYLRVIDIAASTLITREAGGFVKTISGDELDMNLTLDQRTSVVAACSEDVIDSIILRSKK